MDRRENIKMLLSGTLATGFLLTTGCSPEDTKKAKEIIAGGGYGRTLGEIAVDEKLTLDTFFSEQEKKVVHALADIIIPKDGEDPGAVDTGVVEFIEFMMKDYPKFQLPMRGGIMWLENFSLSYFEKGFIDLSPEQQTTLIDKIAYPDTAEPDIMFGVKFFNLVRNLTCTGYFTSKEGLNYLGYVGNRPNQWDGVPEEVLQKFNLSYDQKTLDVCLKIEDQQKVAVWDDQGNLIG